MKASARQWLPIVTAIVALLAATVIVVGISGDEEPGVASAAPSDRLDDVFTRFAASLRPDASYDPPSASERKDIAAAVRSSSSDALRGLGFTLTKDTDPVTGREYLLAISDRAWGVFLIDLSRPVRAGVEVPHPNSDLRTERIGLALFRAVPGSVLLMAGTHRRVERGDVAHRTDSAFHAVATDLADRDIPQVQVHGFHDDSLPDTDVVISPGSGKAGPMIRRIADGIGDGGIEVCRSWDRECGRLEGTSNEQGKMAAERGSVFVHMEMSRSIRDDEPRWGKLVAATAPALTST
jgi:hypothetical protein